MEHEKLLLTSIISLIVGIVVCLICESYYVDITVTIIIVGALVGIIAKGDGLFSKYDDAIISFILGFLSFFLALYFFIPLGALFGSYIFIYSVVVGVVAIIANILKRYFLKPYLGETRIENRKNEISTNVNNTLQNAQSNIARRECPECGALIKESAVFCEKCGVKLPEKVEKIFCSQCGQELSKDDVYCDKCGNKI